jgi:peroxin-7
VDKVVRVWDCRMVKVGGGGGGGVEGGAMVGGTCEVQLRGHEYAVRKVQWSPHRADVLATASYDMTCRVYVSPTLPSIILNI